MGLGSRIGCKVAIAPVQCRLSQTTRPHQLTLTASSDAVKQSIVVALGTYLGATCKESFRRILEAIPTVNAPTGQLKEDSSMNKNMFAPALITAGLMMISPLSANAVSYQVSGMMCDSSFGGGINERSSGLENRKASGKVWVSCPVIKFGSSEDSRVQVNLMNNSNQDVKVSCDLREFDRGREVNRSRGTVSIDGNQFSDEMFWEGGFDEDTHANVVCNLPPGTAIESLSFSTKGKGSSSPDSSADARACITAPTGSFYSSSQTVDFRNGLSANNYNGHSWGSSDETTVFQTSAGVWHVITDTDTPDSEVFQLDVRSEPDSCMEPSYGIPEGVSADRSGDKVLEFTDLEVTVGSGCDMDTGSKLLAYQTDYSYEWLVDINNAETCRVKSFEEL